jgi:hypothetical protein
MQAEVSGANISRSHSRFRLALARRLQRHSASKDGKAMKHGKRKRKGRRSASRGSGEPHSNQEGFGKPKEGRSTSRGSGEAHSNQDGQGIFRVYLVSGEKLLQGRLEHEVSFTKLMEEVRRLANKRASVELQLLSSEGVLDAISWQRMRGSNAHVNLTVVTQPIICGPRFAWNTDAVNHYVTEEVFLGPPPRLCAVMQPNGLSLVCDTLNTTPCVPPRSFQSKTRVLAFLAQLASVSFAFLHQIEPSIQQCGVIYEAPRQSRFSFRFTVTGSPHADDGITAAECWWAKEGVNHTCSLVLPAGLELSEADAENLGATMNLHFRAAMLPWDVELAWRTKFPGKYGIHNLSIRTYFDFACYTPLSSDP